MGDSDPAQRPVTGYPLHQNGQPPVTAYPYQAPPPSSNPYFYPNYPYPNRHAAFLRRLIAALIAVTVVFFVILFILWLVIRPQYPEFSVTSVTLARFNVSATSQLVSGDWDARFQVYNPNKKLKLAYDEVASFVFYKEQLLSRTALPPFSQATHNLTVVEAQSSAIDAYVDSDAAKGLAADRNRGSVGFNLRVEADIRYRAGVFRARRRLLRVFCDNVPVSVPGNGGSGNFTGGPRKCSVYG